MTQHFNELANGKGEITPWLYERSTEKEKERIIFFVFF